MWLHSRRMEETLSRNDPRLQDYLDGLTHALGSAEAAMRSLGGTIQREAFIMTYNDIFWVMGVAAFATVPLALFLRPLPDEMSLSMH